MTYVSSPDLLAVLEELRSGDAEEFWAEVCAAGAPLVERHPTDVTLRSVTFLYRAEQSLAGVYLRINRVTDKDQVARGLMRPVGDTGIWRVGLDLPADLRVSYGFAEIPAGADLEAVLPTLGGRRPAYVAGPDPAHHGLPLVGDGGDPSSVLALDESPPQPEWEVDPEPAVAGVVASLPVELAGRERPVWTYVPRAAGATTVGTLVVCDGGMWFERLGLPAALEAAVRSGRIPPFAVIGIGHHDVPDRVATLGANERLVRDVMSRVGEPLRSQHPELAWGGRDTTVLAGQSLGGVTALAAALDAPQTYGAVIAHSPSMWWRPGGQRSPADLGRGELWLADQFADGPTHPIRLRCAVGSLEGLTVPAVERWQAIAEAAGWEVGLRTYAGGHDFAWWRGALIDDLAALFRSDDV